MRPSDAPQEVERVKGKDRGGHKAAEQDERPPLKWADLTPIGSLVERNVHPQKRFPLDEHQGGDARMEKHKDDFRHARIIGRVSPIV
jgi:hypothetical protein